MGTFSHASFADLDGDGDLDAVVGERYGTLRYFENTGSAIAPAFTARTGAANPFNGVGVAGYSSPSFADLDGDGDLDAVVGEDDGTLHYFENTGTATAPAFTARDGAANPFNGVDVGDLSKPSFADLDGDGDLDAVVGQKYGALRYFQNTGTALAPAFTEQTGAANPLDGVDVGYTSTPSFADLDGDGDLDAVVGESSGTLRYFENTGAGFALVVNVTAQNDAAVLSPDARNLTETNAAAAISDSGTLTISDVDSPATFVAQTGTLGNYGTFAITSAGAWTYTASSAHNEFAAGTTYTDTFQVASADGTPTTVTINILGTNDAAVLSADVRDLSETNVGPCHLRHAHRQRRRQPRQLRGAGRHPRQLRHLRHRQRRRLDLHRKLGAQRVRRRHHLHRHLPGRQRRRHPYLGDHQHRRQQRRRGADRPHHPGHVSREHRQRRRADHRCGRHLHRSRQQLRHRHADGRASARRGHGRDPQPGQRRGRDRRRRQQRQLRRHSHRRLRGRRRQHLHRHLQRGGDGGGDRGADREPDLCQFLGHADREPQPRAQRHGRRRLRRHRAARVRGADRRRQSVQRRHCGDYAYGS